ncbi:hypothetical protein AMTR_s00147p00037410 [Amborella trichopoda]|uniref:Uncharacterized protein n=1 Tax=Amborella trichopoda TaxID=13333 RepID=W1P9J3_AMBTC|nr:hypothetical protein AMTR_s00147p00037410 [Amborella trichopoda]
MYPLTPSHAVPHKPFALVVDLRPLISTVDLGSRDLGPYATAPSSRSTPILALSLSPSNSSPQPETMIPLQHNPSLSLSVPSVATSTPTSFLPLLIHDSTSKHTTSALALPSPSPFPPSCPLPTPLEVASLQPPLVSVSLDAVGSWLDILSLHVEAFQAMPSLLDDSPKVIPLPLEPLSPDSPLIDLNFSSPTLLPSITAAPPPNSPISKPRLGVPFLIFSGTPTIERSLYPPPFSSTDSFYATLTIFSATFLWPCLLQWPLPPLISPMSSLDSVQPLSAPPKQALLPTSAPPYPINNE